MVKPANVSYLDGIRDLQGVQESFRPIHILFSGGARGRYERKPREGGRTKEDDKSLPLFMRNLKEEQRMFSFMINPSEMTKVYKKIVNQHFTRKGWVLEHVSDDLPTMTLKGTTAAFKNPNATDVARATIPNSSAFDVLTTKHMTESIGYKNLIHLIDAYRNNGRVFYEDLFYGDTFGEQKVANTIFSYSQRIERVYPVQIIYGEEAMYEGFFTSMSVSEDADTPYRNDFDLNFTIIRVFEFWRQRVSTAQGTVE